MLINIYKNNNLYKLQKKMPTSKSLKIKIIKFIMSPHLKLPRFKQVGNTLNFVLDS